MSWLGWLTKGKTEVSVLDNLVMFFELAGFVLIVAGLVWVYQKVKK